MKKALITLALCVIGCVAFYFIYPTNITVNIGIEDTNTVAQASASTQATTQAAASPKTDSVQTDSEKDTEKSVKKDDKKSDKKDDTKSEKKDGDKKDNSSKPSSTKEIIAKYTDVMNQLKKDKPTATKKEYQALPDEYRNFSSVINTLLSFADSYMVKEDDKKAVITMTADMQEPDYLMCVAPIGIEPGCLLLDYDPECTGVKECTFEELPDGNCKIYFSLNDEMNPEPTSADTLTPVSEHGAVFAPASRNDIMKELDGIQKKTPAKVNGFDLKYTDCTSELVYNPENNHVVTLTQHLNVDISADITLIKQITGTARLTNDMFLYDVQY